MHKTKIMVVEDEGVVAADLNQSLTALGYQVSASARSGEDAERVAGQSPPDLVLMDIRLNGGIDGIEAANRIREQYDVPVVFLTAHADEPTLQRAKATSPFGYILKPYEERVLHTTIEIALYRHKTEARIKQVEAWLAAILESIGDAVVATDRWGLISFINAAASAATGWDRTEAFGKSLGEVFPLLDAALMNEIKSPVGRVVFDETVFHSDTPLILLGHDKAEHPVAYTASPIRDHQGKITGVVWVFRMDTARHWAEAERTRLMSALQAAPVKVTS